MFINWFLTTRRFLHFQMVSKPFYQFKGRLLSQSICNNHQQYLLTLRSGKWHFQNRPLNTSAMPMSISQCDLSISEDGSQAIIKWNDNEISRYHSIWLRHNCQCDTCQQSNSGQKVIQILDIPERPMLSSATIQPDGATVHLEWDDEPQHVGMVTLDWLKENCYSEKSRKLRRDMNNYKYLQGDIEYFDYTQVRSSKGVYLRYLKYLNEYGICIITGIPNEEDAVLKIGNMLGPIQNTLYGTTFDVKAVEHPINIAYTSVALEYHMDLSYYESSPGIQLLHCLRFDEQVVGGENIFLDIFHVAEDLRTTYPEHFATLCRVPATFQKIHFERENPAAFKYQRPHINIHPVTTHITAVTWSPPFEGALHVKEEDVEPYYHAYRCFAQLLQASPHKEIRLQQGHCAIFNNRRIIHGRRSFELNGGERHFKGCYVNIDDFKNKVQVEHLKQGTGEFAKRVGNQCLF